MASRNVDLVIRAKESASKAFKTVSAALDELNAIQGDVSRGAERLGSAFGKSGSAAKRAADTVGKDIAKGVEQAEKIFARIEGTVAKTTSEFEAQKAALTEAKAAYQALGKQAEAAARAIRKAEKSPTSGEPGEAARLDAMRAAYRQLTREIERAAPKLQRQEAQFARSESELLGVMAAARAAKQALKEMADVRAAATALSAQSAQSAAANEAARKGLARLARAEREIAIEARARAEAQAAAAARVAAANNSAREGIARLAEAEDRLAQVQARRAALARLRETNIANKGGLTGFAGLAAEEQYIRGRIRARQEAKQAAREEARAMRDLSRVQEQQRAAAKVSAVEQEKLAQSFRQAFSAAQQYKTPLQQLWRELTRLGPAADDGARGVRRLSGELLNGRKAFRAFYGDSRRALSLMQRIRGEVLSLTASFVGFYGVFNVGRGVLEAFQRLEAAQNRLGAAFNQDYGKVNAELERLGREASRLGISFDVLADNYSKFLISGQQAGLSVDKLRTIFRQVSEAGRVLKLTNDQIAGTFTALIQIAGKGTLQMEELRQQLGDRLPGAVGLLAKALGYGEGELARFYKDVENGAVSAEEALVALGQGLEDQYGGQLADALSSVTAKIGNLQNILFRRQLTAANSGFIAGLEKALDALNSWLESPEGVNFFKSLGAAMGNIFKALPAILDNMGTLLGLFKAFVSIKIAQVVTGVASAFSGLFSVTTRNLRMQVALNRVVFAFSPAAAAAMRSATALGASLRALRAVAASVAISLRAVWMSVGGPLGIAAIAATDMLFSFLTDSNSAARRLETSMDSASGTIDKVAQALRSAAGDANKLAEELDGVRVLEEKIRLAQLRRDRDALLKDPGRNLGFLTTITGLTGNDFTLDTRTRFLFDLLESDIPKKAFSSFARLDNQFERGEIAARGYREGLARLAETFPDLIGMDSFQALVDYIGKLAEADAAIEKLEASIAVMSGTATDAQKALLAGADVVETAAKKTDQARETMTAYEAVMRSLGERIPSVNQKLREFDAIRAIEEDYRRAMEAANRFADAAQRAAAAQSAADLRGRAYDAFYDAKIRQFDGTDTVDVAAAVIRHFEGFQRTAKWDVNAYRAGFGSDTITRENGVVERVVEGVSVSVEDANRDLLRRITREFIPKVISQIGQQRFDSYNPQQQAALVSIAYNYGSLPDRIVKAIQAGTDDAVAAAIKALGDDNGGVNLSRRRQEAALFVTDAGVESALRAAERKAELERKQAEARKAFRDGLRQERENAEFLASLEGKRLIDAEVAKALRKAENEAAKLGIRLRQKEREEIERGVRAKFAAAQAEEDRNARLEKARALEEKANILQDRRRFLIEQITQLEQQGDLVRVAQLTEELDGVNARLGEALDKAIAFWKALGGPDSERAIIALQQAKLELNKVESSAVVTGRQINDMFADKLTSAFDEFSQRVAAGEDRIQALQAAFQKAAAEILVELGRLIIKQAIFNALAGLFGGGPGAQGGVGGKVAGAINSIFHAGGVVGSGAAKSGRTFSPVIFADAVRYHGGGIAGLAADEVPAILKRNEEVLTENDPRHRFNGGGSPGQPRPMTIINTFDAEEVVERALSTPRGEEVLVNAVRARRAEIKAALG